jgi:hypothetical protein
VASCAYVSLSHIAPAFVSFCLLFCFVTEIGLGVLLKVAKHTSQKNVAEHANKL